MRERAKRHSEFKVRPRQRWPGPGAKRIELLKDAKGRFDARKFEKKATRPLPRKSSRQKSNPQPKLSVGNLLAKDLQDSIAERNREKIVEVVDKLNREKFYGNGLTREEEKAMEDAKKFLREVDSKGS